MCQRTYSERRLVFVSENLFRKKVIVFVSENLFRKKVKSVSELIQKG